MDNRIESQVMSENCEYAVRVEDHAVYCKNNNSIYRKCGIFCGTWLVKDDNDRPCEWFKDKSRIIHYLDKRLNINRKLKIRPLDFDASFFQELHDKNLLGTRKEVDVVYHKPNKYLLGDKCWEEVIINGEFKAFEYKKEHFLFGLCKDDLYKIPKKDIELLRKLQKQNPSLISEKQKKILYFLKCFDKTETLVRSFKIIEIRYLKLKKGD